MMTPHEAHKLYQRNYYHQTKKPPAKKWNIAWVENDKLRTGQFSGLKDIQTNEYLRTVITNKDKFYHLCKGQKKINNIKIERI